MKPEIVVILHDIRSLHNVGSIFRTADAAGVSKIVLTGYTPTPVDRFGNYRTEIAKVALGAEETIAWEKRAQITPALKQLKKEGYKIYAVEQDKKSIPYYTLKKPPQKIALILGNEPKGISAQILKTADGILEIPMHGRKESL